MKSKNFILLSVIVCMGGIAFFFACKLTYEFKVTELSIKAREAFVEALNQELKSRNLEGDFSSYFNAKSPLIMDSLPDSVYMEDASGRYWYKFDPEKNRINITTDARKRFSHSIAFRKSPLLPDSLNARWREWLLKSDTSIQSALCISITNHVGSVKSQNSLNSAWLSSSNLILTVTIGYACEIEVLGYLHYSIWCIMYMEILFYLLLLSVFVYSVYKLCVFIRKKLLSLQTEKIVEVPIIQEVLVIQEIPEVVKEVSSTPIRSYTLRENILFYAEQHILKINGVETLVQSQTCLLFELFLITENNILTDTVIMAKLWPDGTGTLGRVHKAITRLRALVNEFEPPIKIIRGVESYQLLV